MTEDVGEAPSDPLRGPPPPVGEEHGERRYPRVPTRERARALRHSLSPPEIWLWQKLRDRPASLKFRRQHPIGPYILDFYCSTAKLAVEIDGFGHGHERQALHDARRTAWLADLGIRTLRIPATDVMAAIDDVVTLIVLTAAPPPQGEVARRRRDGGGIVAPQLAEGN